MQGDTNHEKNVKRLDGTYDDFIEKLRYVLGSKKEKAAFPTDEDFAEGLKSKNIYTMPARYKAYIFERLENGDSSEYKEIYNRLDSGKLLQGSANLEFWETYNLPEIYQQLVAADNMLATCLLYTSSDCGVPFYLLRV